MEKIVKLCKEYDKLLSLIVVAAVAIVCAAVSILHFGYGTAAVIAIIVIEILLSLLLHGVELWLHGVLVLAEILAGVVCEKTVFVILCVLVYVVTTIAQQVPKTAVGKKSKQ